MPISLFSVRGESKRQNKMADLLLRLAFLFPGLADVLSIGSLRLVGSDGTQVDVEGYRLGHEWGSMGLVVGNLQLLRKLGNFLLQAPALPLPHCCLGLGSTVAL
jgi:hypothetical protein